MFSRLKQLLQALQPSSPAATKVLASPDPFGEETIRGVIDRLVQGGFETVDDVFDIVTDEHLDPSHLNTERRAWIEGEIDRRFADKRREEASWSDETSWDRLDAVFGRLAAEGILALHNAGTTQSDGQSDAGDIWHQRGGENSGLFGYVFYHRQDVDRVLEDGRLFLAFGLLGETGTTPDAVPRRIVTALKHAGFDTDWDGDLGRRIEIRSLKWQKRSPID